MANDVNTGSVKVAPFLRFFAKKATALHCPSVLYPCYKSDAKLHAAGEYYENKTTELNSALRSLISNPK
jgi:hypothetical protein